MDRPYNFFIDRLTLLQQQGNLRSVPGDPDPSVLDLSSNDYLGFAARGEGNASYASYASYASAEAHNCSQFAASASRLLAAQQAPFLRLEQALTDAYHAPAILFNSGYHANTGLVPTFAPRNTLIVADKLVHASIIDGIRLSAAPFERFRHNDYDHLAAILQRKAHLFDLVLIIVESVYSMDGDTADIPRIADIKRLYPNALLYVDEAHAIGVCGPAGLGVCARDNVLQYVDILVGTFSKALASFGAFAILPEPLKQYAVNIARSLIFSTALPPLCVDHSLAMWQRSLQADTEREKLHRLSHILNLTPEPQHIIPVIVGDPHKAINLSQDLLTHGFKVLPIRTPTVPAGTERLRISLSAAMDEQRIRLFADTLRNLLKEL